MMQSLFSLLCTFGGTHGLQIADLQTNQFHTPERILDWSKFGIYQLYQKKGENGNKIFSFQK